MTGIDVLLTIAELALTLGGFGGVVAAFSGTRDRWHPMAVVRFRALILISLGAALLALAPLPLHYGGVADETLWAVASLFAAAVIGVTLLGMIWYARGPMVAHGSRLWSLIAVAVTAGALVVNVLNALSVGFSRSFTGYVCALLLLLVLAGLYFFRLIVLSGPASADVDAGETCRGPARGQPDGLQEGSNHTS